MQAIEEACNLRVKVIKPAIKGLGLSIDDISRKRDQHLRDNSKEILSGVKCEEQSQNYNHEKIPQGS